MESLRGGWLWLWKFEVELRFDDVMMKTTDDGRAMAEHQAELACEHLAGAVPPVSVQGKCERRGEEIDDTLSFCYGSRHINTKYLIP